MARGSLGDGWSTAPLDRFTSCTRNWWSKATLERAAWHRVAFSHAVCLDARVTDVELQLVGGPQREAGGMHRRAQAEARMRGLPRGLLSLLQRADEQEGLRGGGDRRVPCQKFLWLANSRRRRREGMRADWQRCGLEDLYERCAWGSIPAVQRSLISPIGARLVP